MSIQFKCSGCGQAIEVDDELAGQQVGCPYCHTVVTVPSASNLEDAAPLVRDAGSTPSPSPPPVPMAPQAQRVGGRRNMLGWLSLAAVGLSFACFLFASLMLAPILRAASSPAEQQKMMEEEIQSNPGRSFVWIIAGVGAVCIFPLAALTLAIIALVRKSQPQWPSILSISLISVFVLMACAGKIIGGL